MQDKRQKKYRSLKRRKEDVIFYSLYGFDKNNIEAVGWFGEKLNIVEDSSSAKLFPSKNINHLSGYGTPSQWMEFINEDSSLNHGYKFHLVRNLKKAAT